jgi:hypothetical protein
VSPVKYELGFYIPEDGLLHSHCLENLKSYIGTLLSSFRDMRGGGGSFRRLYSSPSRMIRS